MSSVDKRVVELRFDNAQFERGVQTTLKTLDELKRGLTFDESKMNLRSLTDMAKSIKFDNLAGAFETISSKFSVLGIVGVTALSKITGAAIDAGKSMAASLVDPLVEGGKKRALNIEQAKFQFKGLKMDVEQAMSDALYAVQGTAFGLDEAAVAASQFGASGVKLGDDMKNALRGISGVAAMAGSSYTDIANVFTKVAGQGRLMGDDLNRLGTRGINAAATLAEHFNKTGKAMNATEKDIRDMVSKGKVSFTDFSEAMSAAFGEHATKASETYTGALSNMRAALARIGAAVATPYFESQRRIFVALTPVIDKVKIALEPVIELLSTMMSSGADNLVKRLADVDLTALTKGIASVTESFKLVLNAVKAFLIPVRQAFTQIFPPNLSQAILNGAAAFGRFAQKLQVGASSISKIRRIFAGLFAVFSIVGNVVTSLFGSFRSLFSEATKGSSGFVEWLARIGDWLVALDTAIKEGGKFKEFFTGLHKAVLIPLDVIRLVAAAIKNFFTGAKDNQAVEAMDASLSRIKGRFEGIASSLRALGPFWDSFLSGFDRAKKSAEPVLEAIRNKMSEVGKFIVDGLKNFDFKMALDALNTGLFAALVMGIRKFLKAGIGNTSIEFSGAFASMKQTFEGLTNYLDTLQKSVQAKTLMTIAAAIAILAASAVALSMVDSQKLTAALAALTGMFVQLFASMTAFQKMNLTGGGQFIVLASGLVVLSTAVLILSSAVKKLSELSWDELGRGLTGLGTILGSLTATAKLLQGSVGSLISAGVGMAAISVGIRLMANAVSAFGGMAWDEMIRGFAGVGAALVSLALFTRLAAVGKAGLSQSAGILLLSVALRALATAVKSFADMDWGTLGRGFAALVGALVSITATTRLLKGSASGIAAVVVVSGALLVLSKVLKTLGGMSWDEVAKGLVALAGGLAIIAASLYLMSGTLAGSAALLVAAAALALLAPTLVALSQLSWAALGTGLAAVAATFLVLGASALVLTPVVPVLLGLGAAVALLGVGALAAGAGILAFATGLAALSGIGAAGVAAITLLVTGVIALIPKAMAALAKGLVEMAKVITESAPVIAGALGAVLNSLIDTLRTVIPNLLDLLLETLDRLISGLVEFLVANVPRLVDGGLRLLTGILDGISNNIGKVVDSATEVVTKFMDALGENIPKLVDSGFEMVIKVLDGVAKAIEDNVPTLIESGKRLGHAILGGLEQVLTSIPVLGNVYSWGKKIGESIYNGAKNFLEIFSPSRKFKQIGKFVMEGFRQGLVGGRDAVIATYQVLRDSLKKFIDDSNREIESHTRRIEQLKNKNRQIAEERKKLGSAKEIERLRKAEAANKKEIADLEKALRRLNSEKKKAKDALKELRAEWSENRKELLKNARAYDKVMAELEAAKQTLADAKKTRDDYRASITDQYNQLPSLVGDEEDFGLKSWTEATKKQIDDTKRFATALQTLRDRGLNDTLYKKLLEEGPEAMPFVQELLDAGDSGVRDVNKLADELEKASKKLGKTASTELYQAAVDSARGVVDGLKKQKKAIEKEMKAIAKEMVKAIKKELGIKSPSRVFRKLAMQTLDGMVVGIKKSAPMVVNATKSVADTMSSALEAALDSAATIAESDMDISPTITPILDLTKIQKDSNVIGEMFGQTPIRLDTSYSQAAAIASAIRRGEGYLGAGFAPAGTTIEITQNNTSPKALTTAEIYRQTKNALSVAKGALSS